MAYRFDIKRDLPIRQGIISALAPRKELTPERATKRLLLLQNSRSLTHGVNTTLSYHAALRRRAWWMELHRNAYDPAQRLLSALRKARDDADQINRNRAEYNLEPRVLNNAMFLAISNYWRWHDAYIHRVARDWDKLINRGPYKLP